MNTKNNQRKKNTLSSIKKVFFKLLIDKEIKDITVSDICEMAKINRSTFYDNYDDILSLTREICLQIQKDIYQIGKSKSKNDFTWLFQYVLENRDLFTVYFKICKVIDIKVEQYVEMSGEKTEYHFEFFISGVHSIVELWLINGCVEPVEEMSKLLLEKYNKIF